MWNLIVWIVIGALAGWIASKIMKTDAQQGGLANPPWMNFSFRMVQRKKWK